MLTSSQKPKTVVMDVTESQIERPKHGQKRFYNCFGFLQAQCTAHLGYSQPNNTAIGVSYVDFGTVSRTTPVCPHLHGDRLKMGNGFGIIGLMPCPFTKDRIKGNVATKPFIQE